MTRELWTYGQHVLRITPELPTDALALAYLDIPPTLPDNALRITSVGANNGYGMGMNKDSLREGVKQIRVESVLVGRSKSWTPCVRVGSFYEIISKATFALISEPLPAAMLSDVTGSSEYTGLADDDEIRFEYSFAPMRGSYGIASHAWSDPDVQVYREPVVVTADNDVLVTNTPIVGTSVVVEYWDDETLLGELTGTVTDAITGRIAISDKVNAEHSITVSYTGIQRSFPFSGGWVYPEGGGDPIHTLLDLNPAHGHFCVAKQSREFQVVDGDGNAVVDETDQNVTIVEVDTTPTIKPSSELTKRRGAAIFLQPSRIVVHETNAEVWANPHPEAALLWEFGDTPLSYYSIKPIARIYVQPSVGVSQTKVYDMRVRGGGLHEDYIGDTLGFLDADDIDGEVIFKAGVVVVQVTASRMTALGEKAVREQIAKSLPPGVAYLLDVIDD